MAVNQKTSTRFISRDSNKESFKEINKDANNPLTNNSLKQSNFDLEEETILPFKEAVNHLSAVKSRIASDAAELLAAQIGEDFSEVEHRYSKNSTRAGTNQCEKVGERISDRPLIGINTDFHNTSKTVSSHARLNTGYFDCVVKAGGMPIIIPPLNDEGMLKHYVDQLDGMIFTGGLDIDPRRSGQMGHPALQPMAERREYNDRLLMRMILDRRLPILAIGLGMQQLNVMLGGTLFMHLPLDCPKAMPHFDPTGAPHRHIVHLEGNSKIEEIYGDEEIRVNSRHHQAVSTVGKGMRITARCPDGIAEAIESIDPNWFCIGVQWHPEAETATALDMQIFECFLQSAVRSSKRLQIAA